MRQIRLLPIVVFAAVALLAFKTIGLVTHGGYVLVGTTNVVAEEGGHGEDASAATGETDITIPSEPTLADDAPTISDSAPTLSLAPEGEEGGHGAPVGEAHGAAEPAAAAPDHAAPAGTEAPVASDHAEASAQPLQGHLPQEACGTDAQCAASNGGSTPVMVAADGGKSPLPEAASSETEKQLLARLADRRGQLDDLSNELDMRASLVAAAEKRLDERTAELKAMEDRINALVDAQKAAEDEQFKSLVGMYETMKPQDAARIFDALDMDVLLRVGRSMNPRKMAPIMAKMSSQVAQALTMRLAASDTFDTAQVTPSPNDPAALPQIVGH